MITCCCTFFPMFVCVCVCFALAFHSLSDMSWHVDIYPNSLMVQQQCIDTEWEQLLEMFWNTAFESKNRGGGCLICHLFSSKISICHHRWLSPHVHRVMSAAASLFHLLISVQSMRALPDDISIMFDGLLNNNKRTLIVATPWVCYSKILRYLMRKYYLSIFSHWFQKSDWKTQVCCLKIMRLITCHVKIVSLKTSEWPWSL